MKYFITLFILFVSIISVQAQCVLTTGTYTEAQVETCLANCGCSQIEIPDGNTVTMNGDWDLSDQGDINIVIKGETGQLVFPGNGGSVSTLSLTAGSTLTFTDSNNTAPITGGTSNNQPRIELGTTEYFSSDFGDIIAAGGINPITLPVKLTFFAVEQTENGFAKLVWQTASEENNKGFSILKDGVEVAFIPGQGDSSETIDYNWLDMNFDTATPLYQMVQYDLDGSVGYYSDFIAFTKVYTDFEVFPNPVRDVLNVQSPVENVEINIVSLQGQVIQSLQIANSGRVDLSTIPQGIYILQAYKNGQLIFSQKLMKQ